MASEYGWQSVERVGFYDAVVLVEIISDRKKDNMMSMSIATQADPKELRKRLFGNKVSQKVKLDETGLERFKSVLSNRSQFKIK